MLSSLLLAVVVLAFPFLRIRCHPTDQAARPREGTFRRSPLAEFGGDTSHFARHTEGCPCGGGVARSHGRERSGGARERRCFAGHTKTEEILKIQSNMHLDDDYVSVLNTTGYRYVSCEFDRLSG